MKVENSKTQDSNMTKKVWVEPSVEIVSALIEGTINHTSDENVSTPLRGSAS